jgi:hypothetical protein
METCSHVTDLNSRHQPSGRVSGEWRSPAVAALSVGFVVTLLVVGTAQAQALGDPARSSLNPCLLAKSSAR